jgi:protoporphyrinogen oxidase
MSKTIGIVGGGLMGLATAYYLSKAGHKVTVFEKEVQLGGLTTYHDYGPFVWDRFYHVILPSDSALTEFVREIGLGDKLRWRRTYTGFYVDEKFHSMSSNLEFLKFPPVTLAGKIRMALTILYCSRISDWQRLEKIPLERWLLKWSGRATYEKIWKPLLLAKLGENYKRASAVFIWSYIKRMFSARDSSAASKEQLGHVSGGYKAVFDSLAELLHVHNGNVIKGITVKNIAAAEAGGLTITTDTGTEHFDKVIFTGPVNLLKAVTEAGLLSVTETGQQVEYLGVVCAVLLTQKPLVPYYIVNITDQQIPFTGIVAMSNVVSTEETAGLHITYLPKYILSTDPFMQKRDEDVRELFLGGLRRMFPDLQNYGIQVIHINRASKVQPLQVLNYSRLIPEVKTNHPDFYVLNTTQFVNSTLNNNEVIKAVRNFIKTYGDL